VSSQPSADDGERYAVAWIDEGRLVDWMPFLSERTQFQDEGSQLFGAPAMGFHVNRRKIMNLLPFWEWLGAACTTIRSRRVSQGRR
jgi:hypothetical protein